MHTSRFAAALALFVSTPGVAGAPQPQAAAAAAPEVQQVAVEDPGHASITAAIWSPPGAAGAAGTTGAAAQPRYPLIVMSHGTGAGPISHVDTAVALAGAGFVVVAPMHPGDNFLDESSVGKPQWLSDRSRHLGRVIDFMFAQWPGRQQLASGKVGLFGFSAGATSALMLAGGVPDLSLVASHCARQPEFVCRIMTPAQPAAASAPAGDPRVAAAVIVAPGLGFTFEPAGLGKVAIPVQLWSGTADETVPYATNAGVVRRLLPGKVDARPVENAVHLSFLAPCGPESPPQICQDNPGFDRAAFHADFNRGIVEFFRTHLQPGEVKSGEARP